MAHRLLLPGRAVRPGGSRHCRPAGWRSRPGSAAVAWKTPEREAAPLHERGVSTSPPGSVTQQWSLETPLLSRKRSYKCLVRARSDPRVSAPAHRALPDVPDEAPAACPRCVGRRRVPPAGLHTGNRFGPKRVVPGRFSALGENDLLPMLATASVAEFAGLSLACAASVDFSLHRGTRWVVYLGARHGSVRDCVPRRGPVPQRAAATSDR